MDGVDSKGLGPWGGRLAAGCMGDLVFGKIFYPLSVAQATSDCLLNRCWEIQTGIVPGLLAWGFPFSVVYIPSLDYTPSPSTSAALFSEQAVILWLSVLARFFSSLEGPAPPTLTSTRVPVWPGRYLVSAASKRPLRRIHRTQDFLSLLPALLGSLSGVSDLSLCSSWEVGIIPLWIYRDHLLIFIHNNLVLIFVCVRVCMGHSWRPTNSLKQSI